LFAHLPGFLARAYDRFMGSITATRAIPKEIAADLLPLIPKGRLLDVGAGPGRLLLEMDALNPAIELYGLDISAAMVEQARKNLQGRQVKLRVSSIQASDFDSDYFDLVTCTGSLYLWREPEAGLQEVYRILKPGKRAVFYEVDSEAEIGELQRTVRQNLLGRGFFLKLIAPMMLRNALHRAFNRNRLETILQNTGFAGHYLIENKSLSGVPLWIRITMVKD